MPFTLPCKTCPTRIHIPRIFPCPHFHQQLNCFIHVGDFQSLANILEPSKDEDSFYFVCVFASRGHERPDVDTERPTVIRDEEETVQDLVCESGDGGCTERREGPV